MAVYACPNSYQERIQIKLIRFLGNHIIKREVKDLKTKDDFSKGAKITDDGHTFGPTNGGSVNHHSPQSVPNTEVAKTGKQQR